MQQLQEVFFGFPQFDQIFLGNAKERQVDDLAKQGEVGLGVGRGFQDGKFKTLLEAGQDNRRTV
ncbi:MAG TPA: hypothetical protein DCM68_05485 [Verrucomicrobia bacterium]|nr:hypothetical protein [Verrucomicrobiota bacterium]